MDPAYAKKKVIDLSEKQLIALGFLGENALPEVKNIVERARANPDLLGNMTTCFVVDCVRHSVMEKRQRAAAEAAIIEKRELRYSQLINNPEAHTAVAPDLVSEYEKTYWYHGLSDDPPELMWRSDIETNPFPIPPPGTPLSKIPAKTAHGVSNTPLKAVWDKVAPQIIKSLDDSGLKFSTLSAMRYTTELEDGSVTRGPVVVSISVRPNTTTAAAVRDATPDILRILADFHITDVPVEWYEGEVSRLVDEAPQP